MLWRHGWRWAPLRGASISGARLRLSASLSHAREPADRRTERGGRRSRCPLPSTRVLDDIIRSWSQRPRADARTAAVCASVATGRKSQFLTSDIESLIVFGAPIGRPEERFVKALLLRFGTCDSRSDTTYATRRFRQARHQAIRNTSSRSWMYALLVGDRELPTASLRVGGIRVCMASPDLDALVS